MMTRVLLLLVVGALLGTYLLLGSVGEAEEGDVLEDLRIGEVHDNGMFIVYQLGVILTVTLAASSIATEFSWGTIRTLLPRTAGRSPFLTAKLISLGLFVMVVVLLGFLAALVGSALVTAFRDLDSNLGDNFVGHSLASIVRTAYVIVPYAALAFVIALWSRSTAAGIAIPIVVFYAEVLLTPLFTSTESLEWLPDALIYTNISSVLDSNAVVPEEDLPGRWQAAGVLGLYVTGFISLAYGRFLTRDIG
jgi:ABC-2 type transport system permease protein